MSNQKRLQSRDTVLRQVRILPSYKRWRLRILVRDKFTCVICGKRNTRLEVDHYPIPLSVVVRRHDITSLEKAVLDKLLWNVRNGRTLCQHCHKLTPTYGIKALRYLTMPGKKAHNLI